MVETVVTRMDVTRNERYEVLVSLEMNRASSFTDPALVFRRVRGRWRAAIHDRADPSASPLVLPELPPAAAKWLSEAPPFGKPASPNDSIPGDSRVEGGRYALVSEVVGDAPVNGYFARLTPLQPVH